MRFVDQEELEGMGVASLSYPGNGLCHRSQALVKGGGLYDLPLVSQLIVHCLSKLGFLIGDWLGNRSLSYAQDGDHQQEGCHPDCWFRKLQIPHDLTPFGNFVLWHANDDLPACVDRYSARPQNGVRSYKIWEIFPKLFRSAGAIPATPLGSRS